MLQLNAQNYNKPKRPIKIMQFGEGNFLRAFVEWILQDLNDKKAILSDVVVVQPMPFGRVEELRKQDGLYTVCLEGISNGKEVKTRQIIDLLSDFINPFTDYEAFLKYGESEDLEVIVSNTTEAGIAFDETDTDQSVCPKSFPAKLLALLKRRYDFFHGDKSRGLAIVPCELIDNNGEELKKVLLQLAKLIYNDENFTEWLENANHYTDTLVDRIVPGFPKDTVDKIWQETGFIDNNVVKAEAFHLWVLKDEPFVHEKLPADKTGLNVLFVPDIKPYKERKVKLLNGAHTGMVPVAYMCGIDTVREAVTDTDVRKFVKSLMYDTIAPTVKLPENECKKFADSVLERFENPFIRHELMSIALNATTKFRTRLLGTYGDYLLKFGSCPRNILFSFAAMAVFYKGKRGEEDIKLNDNPEYIEFWKEVWAESDCEKVARKALSDESIWQIKLDTDENVKTVAGFIKDMLDFGMRKALQKYLSEKNRK